MNARVLVLGADGDTSALLREWLGELGCEVVEATHGALACPCDLLVVDVPFPRRGMPAAWRPRAGTPVLALSPTFAATVGTHGEAARALGVSAVLPKPLARRALVAAVRSLIGNGP